MAIVRKEQLKALLQSVKELELDESTNGPIAGRPVEVTSYDYSAYGHRFRCLNISGLKRLSSANETVFEFADPSILDSSTDLIAGVYEGGFKVWECTEDLLEYCLTNEIVKAGQIVCDIGCGAGVLGIMALKQKASHVHFLDYNLEVLRWFSLPNILINLATASSTDDELLAVALDRSKFYPGDWQTVNDELGNGVKYDLMLTSETIYSADNYPKLLGLIKGHLKPDGVCLVAAKIYYFGLTGGCFEFIEFVQKDAAFKIEEVRTIEANLQRKILRLKWK